MSWDGEPAHGKMWQVTFSLSDPVGDGLDLAWRVLRSFPTRHGWAETLSASACGQQVELTYLVPDGDLPQVLDQVGQRLVGRDLVAVLAERLDRAVPRAAWVVPRAAWVVLHDGVVVGHLQVQPPGPQLRGAGVQVEVARLFVDPDCRRLGAGRALLDQAVAWGGLRRVGLVFAADAADARRLCQRAGWAHVADVASDLDGTLLAVYLRP